MYLPVHQVRSTSIQGIVMQECYPQVDFNHEKKKNLKSLQRYSDLRMGLCTLVALKNRLL